MAPKLVDGAVLALFVARVKPGGAGPQRIQQQAVGAAGAGREQDVPRLSVAIEAGRGDEPIERAKLQERLAKMAGALHPDLKVVSTDDRNGIITMTEKSTGKIVKLKFDPDKKTMVVIGDDGKEVKISATGDEKSGSLTVQSEEGAVRFGAAAGNAAPAWVPVYPGSAAEGTYAAQTPGGNQSTFTFKTKDAPAKVMSYYQDQLKSAGFTINLISGGDEGGMVQAENASKTRSVILTVGSSSEGTPTRSAGRSTSPSTNASPTRWRRRVYI